jgi:release factor glutamine methyltransferase
MQPPLRIDAELRAARARIDRADAECLLAFVLGRPRSWLFAHGDDALDDAAVARFNALVARRSAGEPVAYLVGHRGFRNLDLAVTPDTLIPRPETELLVELALARIPVDNEAHIADLGTGSGAIALAIAAERPHAHVIATDRSDAALAVARNNASTHALANVEFRNGDWFAPLAGEQFDIIASNPPYIADDDPHLSQGDLRFEPRAALSCGQDGLDAIRSIVRDAPVHLRDDGWLLLEHGHDQGEAVRSLLGNAGFVQVETVQDLEARDRVGLGRWRVS